MKRGLVAILSLFLTGAFLLMPVPAHAEEQPESAVYDGGYALTVTEGNIAEVAAGNTVLFEAGYADGNRISKNGRSVSV